MKRDSKSGMVVFDTQKGPLYIEDENGQALLSDVLGGSVCPLSVMKEAIELFEKPFLPEGWVDWGVYATKGPFSVAIGGCASGPYEKIIADEIRQVVQYLRRKQLEDR